VAASRLDVPGFDTAELLDRLRYFADVVERCGGPAEREAFARIDEATGWRERAGAQRGRGRRGVTDRERDRRECACGPLAA